MLFLLSSPKCHMCVLSTEIIGFGVLAVVEKFCIKLHVTAWVHV